MISESISFTYVTTLETGFLDLSVRNWATTYVVIVVSALKLSNGMSYWPSFSSH